MAGNLTQPPHPGNPAAAEWRRAAKGVLADPGFVLNYRFAEPVVGPNRKRRGEMKRPRRSPIHLIAVALAGLSLAACETAPSLNQLLPSFPSLKSFGALPDFNLDFFAKQACAEVDDEDVKRVNWTRVPEVNMRIRSSEFEPMIIQLKQGWPYVFRIRNRDDRPHVFASRGFFSSMAMIRITVDGKRQDDTCIEKIKIPAKQTAELRLVAAVDGRFEFEDTPMPIPGFFSEGASGVIIVEERFATRYQ